MSTVRAPLCLHCVIPARLTDGREIYPHRSDLREKLIWVCDCGARVGCHPGSNIPLGTPANASLRAARSKVHASLDPIWQHAHLDYKDRPVTKAQRRTIARTARTRVYAYLANAMRLTIESCHVGMFDAAQCHDATRILSGLRYATVRAWAKSHHAEERMIA